MYGVIESDRTQVRHPKSKLYLLALHFALFCMWDPLKWFSLLQNFPLPQSARLLVPPSFLTNGVKDSFLSMHMSKITADSSSTHCFAIIPIRQRELAELEETRRWRRRRGLWYSNLVHDLETALMGLHTSTEGERAVQESKVLPKISLTCSSSGRPFRDKEVIDEGDSR